MFNDPYANPKGSYAHPDWDGDDPRIRKGSGRGAFAGIVLGVLLLLGVLVAVFASNPSGTDDGPANPPPAASTDAPAN